MRNEVRGFHFGIFIHTPNDTASVGSFDMPSRCITNSKYGYLLHYPTEPWNCIPTSNVSAAAQFMSTRSKCPPHSCNRNQIHSPQWWYTECVIIGSESSTTMRSIVTGCSSCWWVKYRYRFNYKLSNGVLKAQIPCQPTRAMQTRRRRRTCSKLLLHTSFWLWKLNASFMVLQTVLELELLERTTTSPFHIMIWGAWMFYVCIAMDCIALDRWKTCSVITIQPLLQYLL